MVLGTYLPHCDGTANISKACLGFRQDDPLWTVLTLARGRSCGPKEVQAPWCRCCTCDGDAPLGPAHLALP